VSQPVAEKERKRTRERETEREGRQYLRIYCRGHTTAPADSRVKYLSLSSILSLERRKRKIPTIWNNGHYGHLSHFLLSLSLSNIYPPSFLFSFFFFPLLFALTTKALSFKQTINQKQFFF
jgi:hypothetical protein